MLTARSDQAWRLATYAVLAALGLMDGVVGAFLVPKAWGGFDDVAMVVALVGNLIAGFVGGFGTGTVGGASAPFAGWFVAVGLLATEPHVSRGGDVVIPGALGNAPGVVHAGIAFMVGGVVASIVPIVLTSRYTERAKTPKSLS